MRLIFLYPLADGSRSSPSLCRASDALSLVNLKDPIDPVFLEKLSDKEFLSLYAKPSGLTTISPIAGHSPSLDSLTSGLPSPPSASSSQAIHSAHISTSLSSSGSLPSLSATSPAPYAQPPLMTTRLEWFSSTKRLPVVAFISTEPAGYTVPLLNTALGLEAFSPHFLGLQMHVASQAIFLHLSLPEPDSVVGTNLLHYVFSLSHFVSLWHPRSTFDVRWLRRLKRISRLQRSPAGQKAINTAKTLRSARLGPCRSIPLLSSIFTCFDDSSVPDVEAVQAQIYSLITSSPIPCFLGDSSSTVGTEIPLNTSPTALFALSPASPMCFVSPFTSCLDFSAAASPSVAPQQLNSFISGLVATANANRQLPTAKTLFLNAVALHPVFFASTTTGATAVPPTTTTKLPSSTSPFSQLPHVLQHGGAAHGHSYPKPAAASSEGKQPAVQKGGHKYKSRGKKFAQHRGGGISHKTAVSVEGS